MCYMHELVCNLQNVNKSVYCFSKSSRTAHFIAVKNDKNMIGVKKFSAVY